MHNESQVLGYQPGDSFIYQLNATTKLVFMLLVSVACMVTYDTRFLIAICILSIFLFKETKIALYPAFYHKSLNFCSFFFPS